MSESKFNNPFRRLSKEEAMLPAIEQRYKGMVQNKMKMYKIGLTLDEIGLLQILIALTPADSLEFTIPPKDLITECQVKYETLRKKMDVLMAHNCITYGGADNEDGRSQRSKKWKVKIHTEDQWSAEVVEKKEMTSEEFLASQEDE